MGWTWSDNQLANQNNTLLTDPHTIPFQAVVSHPYLLRWLSFNSVQSVLVPCFWFSRILVHPSLHIFRSTTSLGVDSFLRGACRCHSSSQRTHSFAHPAVDLACVYASTCDAPGAFLDPDPPPRPLVAPLQGETKK